VGQQVVGQTYDVVGRCTVAVYLVLVWSEASAVNSHSLLALQGHCVTEPVTEPVIGPGRGAE
jgi:hypothetical protein